MRRSSDAWEGEGLMALPMGARGALMRDLQYSIENAGQHDLLMNAAGQTSGMLTERRPAAAILEEMVAEGAEMLANGLPKRSQISVWRHAANETGSCSPI